MSTNIAVPCINNDTALLFEVERNEIEGIDNDISSQLSTDDSVIGHDIGGKYILIMARLAKARRWSKR